MAFCSTCGANVQDGAPCPACGASTMPPPAAPPPSSQADTLLGPGARAASGGFQAAPPPPWSAPPSPSGEWQAPAAAWPSAPQSNPASYPSSGAYPPTPQAPPQGYPASAPGYPQAPPQGYPVSAQGYPPGYPAGAPGYPPNPQGYPPGTPGYPPGYPQGYPPGGAGYPPAQPNVASGKNNKLIAGVIIALAAFYYFVMAANDPKAVVNKCLDGIQEWNSAKVLECVRPADRAQFNEIANVFEQAKAKGLSVRMEQRSIEIGDKTNTSCTARASYVVTMSAPGQQPQTGPVRDVIRLVQDGGKWYIAGSDMLLEVVRRGQQQQFP